jgi:spermidine synthase
MVDKTVLFDGQGDDEHYQVVDMVYNGRQARVLFSGHRSPQSGIAMDDNPRLLFNYNQRFLEIIESVRPKAVLIVGGGAFTLPKAIIERFDDVSVDTVEIDSLLPKLAYEYFSLPKSPELRIITSEGREYINNCERVYDMIILDAFSDSTIPYGLLTQEATKEYARCLSDKGLLALNFISAYHVHKRTLAHRLHETFGSVFVEVDVYPADPSESRHWSQNLVLVASKEEDPALDYLQSAAVSLRPLPADAILRDRV